MAGNCLVRDFTFCVLLYFCIIIVNTIGKRSVSMIEKGNCLRKDEVIVGQCIA